MKNENIIFSLLILIIFTCISSIYFSPVLTGKKIIQHDITQFRGANEEVKKFKEKTSENTYWTNSMFSGMPTFQSGATYPNDFLRTLDSKILRFLPSPIDYIFLLFTGFFFLIMVWLKNWKYALFGAIMFAFSTYFFIIIGAGHNSKVHALAYFPPLVAGIYLLYERKYIWGFIATTLFLGLELVANHPQMTYYLFLAMISFGIIQFIISYKEKHLKSFFISSSLLLLASILAFGMNSSRYLATYEYMKETTRGKSELTIGKKDEKEKTLGLDRSYITQWSYGKLETLNLFIPNFMGGSSNEKGFKPTHFQSEIESMVKNGVIKNEDQYRKLTSSFSGSYWGDQPMTSGPAYQGVIVIFLALLGLFFYQNKYKWWLISATALSILLAWGHNFAILTNFFIDYFPMYNKFRAVSSILVIAEFTLPLLAILGLYSFFNDEKLSKKYKKKIIYYAGGFIISLLLFFYFFGSSIFNFYNAIEGANMPDELLSALKEDRLVLFKADVLRTLLFVLISLILLLANLFDKIKSKIIIILILSILSLADLWTINKRYLNDENFISAKIANNPFLITPLSDTENNPILEQLSAQSSLNKTLYDIQQNDKTHYRILNTTLGFDENTTSYFHQSIGGYHAAKLRRYQDILDIHLNFNKKANPEVLNMLNTKYIILGDPTKPKVQINPYNNGNAWFVQNIKFTQNPDNEILALNDIKTNITAVVNEKDKSSIEKLKLGIDTTATIKLIKYQPNHLTYTSQSKENQLAIFSEIYYPYGWNAFIDGEKISHIRCNYTLRGLSVPKGKHTIEFIFQPKVIKVGATLSLISFLLFIIISLVALFLFYRKGKLK